MTDILAAKYPYTIKLAVVASDPETVVGIGAGMVSAIKRYSFWDVLVTLVTSVLVAMPAFWLGMLLQLFFGVVAARLAPAAPSDLPISADCSRADLRLPELDALHPARHHARGRSPRPTPPASCARSCSTSMNSRTTSAPRRAKGLAPSPRHLATTPSRTALIPVVAYIGDRPRQRCWPGAILTETVFNWPGVGLRGLPRHHPARLAHRSWAPSRSSSAWLAWSSASSSTSPTPSSTRSIRYGAPEEARGSSVRCAQ